MKITVDNLNFGYFKNQLILNNINLKVNYGETIAIVGISGCGKTTLLKLVAGLINKTTEYYYNGKILIDGLDPNSNRLLGNLSFMFQEPTLFPFLTVYENIRLPLDIKDKNKLSESSLSIISRLFSENSLKLDKSNQITDRLIENVGLTGYKDFYPPQLSGGMKTRASLARTFISSPDLLLLDEPFSSLDINWKNNLYKDLNKLKELFKSTIILVTHDINEALTLANHIVILNNNGEIVEEIVISHNLPRTPDETATNLNKEFGFIYNKLLEKKLR